MTAEEVTLTLNIAISVTGVKAERIERRPRLLSDNGSCYISGYLKDYLNVQDMSHTRGRPFHPQTQGKIERYHRSMKNILLLDNYYLPQELETQIAAWVDYYNNRRYHESLGNITPSDKYAGREKKIFKERRKVKERTIRLRRRVNGFTIKGTGVQIPVSTI